MNQLYSHTISCSDTLIGNLCREFDCILCQHRSTCALVGQCTDAPLLKRLEGELGLLKDQAMSLQKIALSPSMDVMSDQLSIAFLREVSRRTMQVFSRY
ncbi:MAG: hypothetical protein CBB79_04845 [Synechococcus sp. TMED19]|nr:MAG: hypothetical protein CBB79_04845 [Synechococcus sp. TMED19]